MPFRIMISLMVIGLMLPAVMALVDDYEDRSDAREADDIARFVADTAEEVYVAGPGNSISAVLDISPGRAVGIGGESADAYSVRAMVDGEVVGRIMLDAPVFRIMSEDTILSGYCTLLFRAVMSEGRLCVEVTRS